MQDMTIQARTRDRNSGASFGKSRNTGSRPLQAVNLSRLASALDIDLLSSALGVSEQALRGIIEGRNQIQFLEQQAHLSHRLDEAGFPRSWLNTPSAILRPEHVNALRVLSAGSSNKAPLRRNNLKKLIAAFSGRHNVLADALEVNEWSLHDVVDGRLEFDDQRFNHFNPRLMEAGFEDGWLDLPDAGLTDALVANLEALATDIYERSFEEQTSASTAKAPATPQPETPLAVAPQPQPVSGDLFAAPQPPDFITANAVIEVKTPKEPFMPATQAQATTPVATQVKLKLPRGVMAAGKSMVGAPTATGAKRIGRPPSAEGMATTPTKARATQTGVRRTMGLSRDDGVTKEQSLARAVALDTLLDTARRGAKVTLWRDLLDSSLPYWGNIRRGTVLFRDELANRATAALGLPNGWLDSPKFPPATLAAWVTNANVPLPASTTAASASASPQPRAPKALEPQAYSSVAKPFLKGAPPAPTLVMAPAAAPAKPPVVAQAPAAPVAKQAPRVVVARAAAAPAPVAAPTPTQAQIAATVPTQQSGYAWSPAAEPIPCVVPGPLTQALGSVLNRLAVEGKFTEDDAMRMIHFLMAP